MPGHIYTCSAFHLLVLPLRLVRPECRTPYSAFSLHLSALFSQLQAREVCHHKYTYRQMGVYQQMKCDEIALHSHSCMCGLRPRPTATIDNLNASPPVSIRQPLLSWAPQLHHLSHLPSPFLSLFTLSIIIHACAVPPSQFHKAVLCSS